MLAADLAPYRRRRSQKRLRFQTTMLQQEIGEREDDPMVFPMSLPPFGETIGLDNSVNELGIGAIAPPVPCCWWGSRDGFVLSGDATPANRSETEEFVSVEEVV